MKEFNRENFFPFKNRFNNDDIIKYFQNNTEKIHEGFVIGKYGEPNSNKKIKDSLDILFFTPNKEPCQECKNYAHQLDLALHEYKKKYKAIIPDGGASANAEQVRTQYVPVPYNISYSLYSFTATAGQSSFTPSSTDISASNMQVFHNGLILNQTEDYSIGSPSVTITDGAGLTAGDHVDVIIRRS